MKTSMQGTIRVLCRFTGVPDSILLSNIASTQQSNTIDSSIDRQGTEAPVTKTDFAQYGQARDRVLGLKLDQVSDSVSGQSTIDPKGYLTDLGGVAIKSDAEISDIKKARMLLRSVITTNPKVLCLLMIAWTGLDSCCET